jgi:hypothetical protein
MVVFDAPALTSVENSEDMREARNSLCRIYPDLVCVQLVVDEPPIFSLEAYRCGVKAVIPRPSLIDEPGSFADPFIALVELLPSYLF